MKKIEYTQKPINLKYSKERFKPGETNILYDSIDEGIEQNLYLVSTPGQLLSAIEAQNHFQTKNNVLVILFFAIRDGKNINQMFRLSNMFPYDKLITYQNRNKNNSAAFVKYLDVITKHNYDYVFVGYNSILYRRMITNLAFENLFSLDTGGHTIVMQEQLYNDNNKQLQSPYTPFSKRTKKGKLATAIYTLNGYKMDSRFEVLNFFTVFNLSPYKSEQIVTHNYEYVKSLFSHDLDLYRSTLFDIYNASVKGQSELLHRKSILDIPIEDKMSVSSCGVPLDIYPSGIKTIDTYYNRISSSLISLEKQYLTNKLISDREFLKGLQSALVLKDYVAFELIINNMVDSFRVRIIDIESTEYNKNKIKRIIGLLSTLNESFKLLVEANDRFDNKVNVNEFYEFFDYILKLNKSVLYGEAKVLTYKYIHRILVNHAKSITSDSKRDRLEEYIFKNSELLKHKKLDILIDLPDYYHKGSSSLKQMLIQQYNTYTETCKYKQSPRYFYQTLKMACKLKKNIDTLSNYFITKNFKINNVKHHLDALGLLIEKSKNYKVVKNRIWDIYSRSKFSREERISAGLLLVEYYHNNDRHTKGVKLYFQVLKHLGSNNRKEALLYLDTMVALNLNKLHRELFESLYNQHIFGPFTTTYNSDVVLDFLRYQKIIYGNEKEQNRSYEYTQKPLGLQYSKESFKPGETNILYDNIEEGVEQNLYLVSTPGQLLSAIEAQNHFQTKNNVLVILFFAIRDGKNINQMFRLSNMFPYDKLITYQNKSAKFYISFIPFLKEITKTKYNYLFVGFNTILYRRMVANIEYKNLYYLDDGVHTITTHEDIYNDNNQQTRPEYIPFPKTMNLQKMKFIYSLRGFKVDTYLNDLNFFTVYNLKQYKNEKIVKHDFSYISSLLIDKCQKQSKVYVLGQPLVEQVGVEQHIYNNYLKTVFEYYDNREILYIPHRLEVVHDEIKEYISNRSSISKFVPNDPIEFYFLNNKIYPSDVVSFITSALFNIRKLFPETKTRAFKIDTSYLDIHHKKGIALIYEHYKNEEVEIIDMNN